jgi:hypothetical protein
VQQVYCYPTLDTFSVGPIEAQNRRNFRPPLHLRRKTTVGPPPRIENSELRI